MHHHKILNHYLVIQGDNWYNIIDGYAICILHILAWHIQTRSLDLSILVTVSPSYNEGYITVSERLFVPIGEELDENLIISASCFLIAFFCIFKAYFLIPPFLPRIWKFRSIYLKDIVESLKDI